MVARAALALITFTVWGFPLIEFLFIVIVGSGVGLISGMFGIGGGFLLVPVLHVGLGIPIQIAVGSAACQVLGPATTSVLARRLKPEDFRLPLIVAGGTTAGVHAGAGLLHLMTGGGESSQHSGSTGADVIVLSIYFPLLLILGGFSLWEAQRASQLRPLETGWIARWEIPPTFRSSGFPQQVMSIPVLCWFGLAVGFLSGFLGMSGGLLLLPGLIYLLGLPWPTAVASSMSIVWLIALQSTVAHAWHGHIRLPIVAGLLISGTFGARLGVSISRQVSAVQGRRSFGWLALGTAAVIAWRLESLLTGNAG